MAKRKVKKCGFGLSCASMMLQPGLEPGDCPNYEVCGASYEIQRDEEVRLYYRPPERAEAPPESMWMSAREIAALMLMQRGNPQRLDSFDVGQQLEQLQQGLARVRSRHDALEGQYIAPVGSAVQTYLVKRGYANYQYNKLAHPDAIFAPEKKRVYVKVIHLSRNDDPRNIEGRLGVARCRALLEAKRQLEKAQQALAEAERLLTDFPVDESEAIAISDRSS